MKPSLANYEIICLSASNSTMYIEKIADIKVTKKNFYEDYNSLLKNNIHVIVIISASRLTSMIENSILSIKLRFNHVPIILHLNKFELETARKCGELGVNKIITNCEEELAETIHTVVNNQQTIVLRDFDIDEECYPKLVRNALKIIETNHIKLMGTREIADILSVSDCTLIREFRKYKILSPKQLLLYFKVKHALILMNASGLSLKEIADMTGFSNERRFNECFHRVFNKPPGLIRKRLSIQFIDNFGKNLATYEYS